jgi:aminoglycoside phosphotransferase (APT) family kinase protein
MMDSTQPELVDVLPQHRIDDAAVTAALRPHLRDDFDGELRIRQFQGGQSNPTYHLSSNVGDNVLRKKPPGKLLPSAHAVEREYRVMNALHGSAVPVPRMLMLCEDSAVIGTPFFVMQHVSGRLMGARLPQSGSREDRLALQLDLARVLGELHRLDYRALGLDDFGRPDNYLQRQVARWGAQWEASRNEDVPEMERLREWLPQHLPDDSEASIVHGDYRLGNVLVEPRLPKVAVVLDWELCTLGHPLSDLGYVCQMYHQPPAQGGCLGLDLAAEGILPQDEFIAAYCAAAGRTEPADMTVFIVFSMFRLAAIQAGVYRRALDGNAADSRALQRGSSFKALAEQAWALAERAA